MKDIPLNIQMLQLLIIVLSSSFVPILMFFYWQRLIYQKGKLISRSLSDDIIRSYSTEGIIWKAIENPGNSKEGQAALNFEIIKRDIIPLFFKKRFYFFPILVNFLVGFVYSFCFVNELEGNFANVNQHFFWGALGSFIWCSKDLLTRYSRTDIGSVALHLTWIRIVFGSVLGLIVGAYLKLDSPFLSVILAFYIGSISIESVYSFLGNTLSKHINVPQQKEDPSRNLTELQGVSQATIDRLGEVGIFTITELAYADPIKLLFNTSIEWTEILDMMDQALLHVYLEEKAKLLRKFGIRGAIELSTLNLNSFKTNVNELKQAIARELSLELVVIDNLVLEIYYDSQINFVWRLWGGIDQKTRV
jgi:hypothetical protein